MKKQPFTLFMKVFKLQNVAYLLFVSVALLSGCEKKKDNPLPFSVARNSIFIVNEGSSNGTISYLDKNNLQTIADIYGSVNGSALLGGQLQSMAIIGDKGYICVQSGSKVRVVNINTFTSLPDVSTGISNLSPRYFIQASSTTGYLSDWGTDKVLVIDLVSNTLISQISSSGVGPDFMFKFGSKVYVAYKGGYGSDNKVGVINTLNNLLESVINVGASPSAIVSDANGKLWVLCGGAYNSSYSALQTSASLYKINPVTNAIELNLSFNDLDVSAIAGSLNTNSTGDVLFYTFKGKTFKMDISSTTLPTTEFINRDFYGISVDPSNNQIIGCFAPSFTASGRIIRYQPSGVAVDSFSVGIGPARCLFY